MILEIEGILSIASTSFVLFSLLRFTRYFYKNTVVAIYRIKLSKNVVGLFTLLLSANVLLLIFYFFAAGIFFFLELSYVIKGNETGWLS
ncbi:hypothetical protein M1112_02175 [Candidatus Parvarchaeota archaeon]|nr:hypothetical protein [Candidatus Parvarchaeota archaeon]